MWIGLMREQEVETSTNLPNLYRQLKMVGYTDKDPPKPSLKGHRLV